MFTKVKGTYDILPKDAKKVSSLEFYLRQLVSLYGYEEIRVPILVTTDLIHRSSGETSDIVMKETFDFKDRGDRLLSLRPEGTAPVIRSVIENKLYASETLPLKLFYIGEMFRYERPQKGRFREFSQFGVECIGTSSAYMDAEVITLAATIFRSLQIKNYVVRINTLGDNESRGAFRDALIKYLAPHKEELCDDCKARLENNPLRILDCKIDSGKDLLKKAPKISDYLSDKSKAEFEEVKNYLDILNIPYIVDENLVRGLDYYTNTVFEVEIKPEKETENSGQSLTICAGGRYDNLVKDFGGPNLGSVGFAFGLERLLDILPNDNTNYSKKILVQLIPIGINAKAHMVKLLQELRARGFSCEMDYEATSLKSHFKSAEANNAHYLVIEGDDELKDATCQVKNKVTNIDKVIDEKDLQNYMIKGLHTNCGSDCESCEGDCDEK